MSNGIYRFVRKTRPVWFLIILSLLWACEQSTWNNPYPLVDDQANILYSSFGERPKHLDPARSYSENEANINYQIYETPLQYHYLKRPYELVPNALETMPSVLYLDAEGNVLPEDASESNIRFSVYRLQVKPGIRYQPHPAFAKNDSNQFIYHQLDEIQLQGVQEIGDFAHSGSRELLAKDFVYQIKRLAHPQLDSPIYGLMGGYIVGLKDLGNTLNEVNKRLMDKPVGHRFIDLREFELEGVKVIDPYTYEIKIHGKYPQFVYWLAMTFFAPVPYEVDYFYSQPGMKQRNITLDWFPVGTGPYMLTRNNPNLQMVLERNPNFHHETYPTQGSPGDRESGLLDDAGKTVPFIDKVIYSLEKEAIPSWNKFLQGYYDSSGISSDSFDQAVSYSGQGDAVLTDSMKEKGIRLLTSVAASTYYMGFNMRDDVVGGLSVERAKLRQAISILMNYEEYISIFMNGRGLAAQGPVAPGIFGYLEGEQGINPYVYDWIDGREQRKSLDEAKRLLAEAGYPNGRDAKTGKPLVIHFDTPAVGPAAKSRLDWYRKQFQKVGLQLDIRSTTYNRFQDKMLKGTAQMFQWGWNADYPDPENFMFLLYGPNAKAGKNGENAANYQNPQFDALFERMKNMNNSPERLAIISAMTNIARRDAPWIWGLHPKEFGLYHQWFKNIKPNLMARNTVKYKRIDAELRSQLRQQWNRPILWPVYVLLAVLVMAIIPAIVVHRRKAFAQGVA